MKKLKPYLQIVTAIFLFFFLFAFADGRNKERKIIEVGVQFKGENKLFITQEEVNKLLIQNYTSVTNVTKDALDLNNMEHTLANNQMIKDAEVYVTIDGQLKAEVTQKKPLARIVGNKPCYIDDRGELMPLSHNYSARVPLVSGDINKENKNELFEVVKTITADPFLEENIIGVQAVEDGFVLLMRSNDFKIKLGDTENLDIKIKKLKAFYQKALKDSSLDKYSWVNLKFSNQVVCTKK